MPQVEELNHQKLACGGAGMSPWGKTASLNSASVSLADVMSEELADHLQKKEAQKKIRQTGAGTKDTSEDMNNEKMLQLETEAETSTTFRLRQNSEYLSDDLSDQEEEEEDYFSEDDWESFETKESGLDGVKKNGDTVVSKHDKELSQRKNAKRIMEFPPGLDIRDGGGGAQVSSKVYNKVRNFSMREDKRKNRLSDKEDKATTEKALDPRTRVMIYKLVNGGFLDSVNGVISMGKEAVIFHADGGPGPQDCHKPKPYNIPQECVLKVFKTTLNEFKTRDKYIKDDYRFRKRSKQQNPRKILNMWAEKEMRNLVRMSRGGIRVPEVVLLRNQVLLMSFIGQEGKAAPKLKDAAERMSGEDLGSAYSQVVEMMRTLYSVCHLVHADLSEYNILWWKKEAWFIDVSQAVEPSYPAGLDFLLRDCTNIVNFFSKKGLQFYAPHELFNLVTGLEVKDGSEADIVTQIRRYQKNQAVRKGLSAEVVQVEGLEEKEEDNFDYCWDQSLDLKITEETFIPGH